MRNFFLLLLIVLFPRSLVVGQDILEFNKNPYRAGFKVLRVIDHSRPYKSKFKPDGSVEKDRGRPIHIYIWYPTEETTDRMLFEDYVYLSSLKYEPGKINEEGKNAEGKNLLTLINEYGFHPSKASLKLEELLNFKTQALKNSNPVTARFPLLIISSGLRTGAFVQTMLAEYLAGHGYIVVTVPSLGINDREPTPFDLTGVDMQTRDMEVILNELHDDEHIDFNNIGLIAWSVGGVSTALLQMKNQDIGAILSLDGGTGYQYGFDMLNLSPFSNFKKVDIPYLHMHGLKNKYNVPKNFGYYDSLSRNDAYLIEFKNFDHYHFTSIGNILNLIKDRDDEIVQNYRAAVDVATVFLNAYLKASPIDLKKMRSFPENQLIDNRFSVKKKLK